MLPVALLMIIHYLRPLQKGCHSYKECHGLHARTDVFSWLSRYWPGQAKEGDLQVNRLNRVNAAKSIQGSVGDWLVELSVNIKS